MLNVMHNQMLTLQCNICCVCWKCQDFRYVFERIKMQQKLGRNIIQSIVIKDFKEIIK